MQLIKKYVGSLYENHIELEAISDNMLMVTINKAEPCSKGVHCYWRLTGYDDTTIPPLEIGIHFFEQSIDNISFFVAKGMTLNTIPSELTTIIGSVLPDISIFTKQYDCVDVDKVYNISLSDDKLVVYWEDINNSCIAYRNKRLEFYVDQSNRIRGFAILNLTIIELELLNKYI